MCELEWEEVCESECVLYTVFWRMKVSVPLFHYNVSVGESEIECVYSWVCVCEVRVSAIE